MRVTVSVGKEKIIIVQQFVNELLGRPVNSAVNVALVLRAGC